MAIDGGTMTVDAPSGGSGFHTGGNGNGGDSGSNSGGSSGSPAQAMAPLGVLVQVAPVNGSWGITIFNTTAVADAVAAALASIESALVAGLPVVGRVAGVFGLLAPSPLAPATIDHTNFTGFAVALPGSKVLSGSLPTDPATVVSAPVKARVVDDVKDEKQHVAVVAIKGLTQSVPVVDAKPTNKPGVYSASIVPGMPAMEVRVTADKPSVQSTVKGVTPESGEARPAGYTAGGNTNDAILRFPPNTKIDPIYISVTGTLTVNQVKERQEKEKQYQEAWDAAHPVEVAELKLKSATADLQRVDDDIKKLQDEIATVKKMLPVYKSAVEHPVPGQEQFNRIAMKNYQKALERSEEAPKELSIALESRKQKEKSKKDAEAKLDDEKKKPRKGLKEYGQDYIPAPKTEEIKGLGDLTRASKRTPKQAGGGMRDRWKGDKGRKLYEWDSQHGELEGYRASDGEHIGAFDHKTGVQIKNPDPKRNIKKYL